MGVFKEILHSCDRFASWSRQKDPEGCLLSPVTGKSTLHKGKSQCKHLEAGVYLGSLRVEASEAEECGR